jgi:hypothetical protein
MTTYIPLILSPVLVRVLLPNLKRAMEGGPGRKGGSTTRKEGRSRNQGSEGKVEWD